MNAHMKKTRVIIIDTTQKSPENPKGQRVGSIVYAKMGDHGLTNTDW
jgi:hypothetical protein